MPNGQTVPAMRRPPLLARLGAWLARGYGWTGSPGPLSGPAAVTQDGLIPLNWPINFGQLAYDPIGLGVHNSVVYACISLYARTIAQLPARHMRTLANGGTEEIKTSAMSRILRKPNLYQTRSDFMFNLVTSLLDDGNGYALALRNDAFQADSLHLLRPRNTHPLITPDGDVFYAVGTNQVLAAMPEFWADPMRQIQGRWIVPERDILHVRAWCPRHPLIGESPLVAAASPILAQSQGLGSMAAFYANMARPSGVLQTDLILSKEQVAELRERWNEQASGAAIGGTPILTAGLKWQAAAAVNAVDAQVAELLKYSTADIARVYGVPLAMINDMTGATYNNTEQLIMTWLRMGLGFYLEHIELNFDKLFGFERADDFCELDVKALLRPDFKTQIEGLGKAVVSGLYAPNEGRAELGLPKVASGDEPRVQQQMVPLSWEPPEPAPPAAPAQDPPAEDDPPEDDPPAEDDAKGIELDRADSRALAGARLRAMMGGRHAPGL